jgi:CheY-like chemotaxis protein
MQPRSYHIFYTDDDTDDQDFFREVVNEINDSHKVVTQNHGNELMQLLITSPSPEPDIVFLDLNMPMKNGFEVLKEIRSDEKFNHIPVVILSTSNTEDSINACKELGANLYISKPGSYEMLKKIMQKVLAMDWKKFHYTKGNADNFVFIAH